MRILVMSDNHGDWKAVESALKMYPHDYSIHLGDAEMDEALMKRTFNRYVGGNHDFGYAKYEDFFSLEGVNFYIAHGHLISMWGNFIEKAAKKGADLGASVVLIGHLHYPLFKEVQGVSLYCPGSVSQPRSTDGPTCLMLEVDAGKVISHQFLQVKR